MRFQQDQATVVELIKFTRISVLQVFQFCSYSMSLHNSSTPKMICYHPIHTPLTDALEALVYTKKIFKTKKRIKIK